MDAGISMLPVGTFDSLCVFPLIFKVSFTSKAVSLLLGFGIASELENHDFCIKNKSFANAKKNIEKYHGVFELLELMGSLQRQEALGATRQ